MDVDAMTDGTWEAYTRRHWEVAARGEPPRRDALCWRGEWQPLARAHEDDDGVGGLMHLLL
jgi:hypothetical protein